MTRLTLACTLLGAAIFTSPAALADPQDAWKLALQHCVGAFERIKPVDTSEMTATDAPDWAPADAETETFLAAPGVYMMITGEIEEGLASCTVAAEGADVVDDFKGWAIEAAKAGIYGPVAGEDLTHLETIDWREPRMELKVEVKDGVTWIHTFEVPKEA